MPPLSTDRKILPHPFAHLLEPQTFPPTKIYIYLDPMLDPKITPPRKQLDTSSCKQMIAISSVKKCEALLCIHPIRILLNLISWEPSLYRLGEVPVNIILPTERGSSIFLVEGSQFQTVLITENFIIRSGNKCSPPVNIICRSSLFYIELGLG